MRHEALFIHATWVHAINPLALATRTHTHAAIVVFPPPTYMMQMAHDGWCTLYDKAQSAAPLPVGAAINSLRTDRLNCMAGHIHALEMGRCWSRIWVSKAGRRCTHSSCPPPCPIVMRPTQQTKELKQAVILELLSASRRTVDGGFFVSCLAGGCLLEKDHGLCVESISAE